MQRGWETFAGRLAWAMRECEMGESELARAVDLKQPTIHHLATKGKKSGYTGKLARALGVNADWLATGNGAPDGQHKVKKGEPSKSPEAPDLVIVRELDVRPRAGRGGGTIEVNETDEEDVTVARHGFPADGFRALYGAEPERVRIIEVVGDSMEPMLFPGQKVMVDTQSRAPTPPGIFIVFDGLGLVLKRVQYITGSEPPRVKLTSANPEYDPYECMLDEARIQGRVIGAWRRM